MENTSNVKVENEYLETNFIFDPEKPIGTGGFGKVFRVVHKTDGKEYALKYFGMLEDEEERESTIFQTIPHHENVVLYYKSWFENPTKKFENIYLTPGPEKYVFIQMEYCGEGDLRKWLNLESTRLLADADDIFLQVLKALAHIHGLSPKPIIHRDIKPENIFISKSGFNLIAKLGDFGLAREFDHTHMTSRVGSSFYKAPELKIRRNKTYTQKVDIYSVGKIYYELYSDSNTNTREARRDWEDILEKMDDLEIPEKFQTTYPSKVELLKSLISSVPTVRPNASDLLNQPPESLKTENHILAENEKIILEDALDKEKTKHDNALKEEVNKTIIIRDLPALEDIHQEKAKLVFEIITNCPYRHIPHDELEKIGKNWSEKMEISFKLWKFRLEILLEKQEVEMIRIVEEEAFKKFMTDRVFYKEKDLFAVHSTAIFDEVSQLALEDALIDFSTKLPNSLKDSDKVQAIKALEGKITAEFNKHKTEMQKEAEHTEELAERCREKWRQHFVSKGIEKMEIVYSKSQLEKIRKTFGRNILDGFESDICFKLARLPVQKIAAQLTILKEEMVNKKTQLEINIKIIEIKALEIFKEIIDSELEKSYLKIDSANLYLIFERAFENAIKFIENILRDVAKGADINAIYETLKEKFSLQCTYRQKKLEMLEALEKREVKIKKIEEQIIEDYVTELDEISSPSLAREDRGKLEPIYLKHLSLLKRYFEGELLQKLQKSDREVLYNSLEEKLYKKFETIIKKYAYCIGYSPDDNRIYYYYYD